MTHNKHKVPFTKIWPALPAGGLALGALALLWRVRDTPLTLGVFARFDALSAFFLFALFGGITLALAARPTSLSPRWLRPMAAAGALALAYTTTLMLLIACAYLLLALLTFDWPTLAPPEQDRPTSPVRRAIRVLRRAVLAAPSLLASSCLLLGYAALALRGAARYDDRTAGAALDSFAFWFVLLAASIACAPLFQATTDHHPPTETRGQETRDRRPETGDPRQETRDRRTNRSRHSSLVTRHSSPVTPSPRHPITLNLFRFAWIYPLARLYSLGPWNSGWSFATLLLGGALALWCACSALVQPDIVARNARMQSIYLALALASLGLSNSAGIAAACYGVLAYLVLVVGHRDWRLETSAAEPNSQFSILLPWLLSSAVPLTAPFVAAWMLIGASVAGGVALLAGLAWLVALLHGLTVALWNSGNGAELARRPLLVAGTASLVLGVGAPPIARLLILPVVTQLQGGLTPFGDLNIWPWVGVAASDSAHTQVTTLPSIAIALLMLVLTALVFVVARLREIGRTEAEQPAEQPAAEVPASTLLRYLRAEVPWLGGLLGTNPRSQRQPGDGE
jgi:hypothetical protein